MISASGTIPEERAGSQLFRAWRTKDVHEVERLMSLTLH
jgi:hypothetical protein